MVSVAPARARAWTRPGVLAAMLVVLLACFALALTIGSRQLGVGELLAALGGDGGAEAGSILFDQRLPRGVLAVAGGAALAVAGVLVQGHTRNPLADPGLLGVTAGASLAVVLAIAFLGADRPTEYLWFALAGAGAATVLVVTLGRLAGGRRNSSPATLVLAGAAVSSILGAASGIVLLLSSSTLDRFRFFTVGSLSGDHDLAALWPAFACLLAGVAIAVTHVGALNALVLGDDTARSLGHDVRRARLVGLGAVTLLTGGAVMCVGSLGFVGLVVPHLVRHLVGNDHRWVVPSSVLVGSTLVLVADVLGRVVVRPAEVPVGVVVAMGGAPVFLAIVASVRRPRR